MLHIHAFCTHSRTIIFDKARLLIQGPDQGDSTAYSLLPLGVIFLLDLKLFVEGSKPKFWIEFGGYLMGRESQNIRAIEVFNTIRHL